MSTRRGRGSSIATVRRTRPIPGRQRSCEGEATRLLAGEPVADGDPGSGSSGHDLCTLYARVWDPFETSSDPSEPLPTAETLKERASEVLEMQMSRDRVRGTSESASANSMSCTPDTLACAGTDTLMATVPEEVLPSDP